MTIAPRVRPGTCAFRLMPYDPLVSDESSAVLTPLGPSAVSIAYEWVHPTDGPQQGVLLVGGGPEGAGPDDEPPVGDDVEITIAWADSWHQQPGLRTLHGRRRGGRAEASATYAGDWGWVVVLDGLDGAAELAMVMRNVVPESSQDMLPDDGGPDGAYDVMVATWGGR